MKDSQALREKIDAIIPIGFLTPRNELFLDNVRHVIRDIHKPVTVLAELHRIMHARGTPHYTLQLLHKLQSTEAGRDFLSQLEVSGTSTGEHLITSTSLSDLINEVSEENEAEDGTDPVRLYASFIALGEGPTSAATKDYSHYFPVSQNDHGHLLIELRLLVGRYCQSLHKMQQATPWFEAALTEAHTLLGEQHCITTQIKLYLAIHLRNLCEYKKAEAAMTEILKSAPEANARLHANISLAILWLYTKRAKEGEAKLQYCYDTAEQSLEATCILKWLGFASFQLRDYREAKSRYCKVKETCPKGSFLWAATRHSLAEIYVEEGQADKAIILYEEALAEKGESGMDHLEALSSQLGLAEALWLDKRVNKAREVCIQACEGMERVYGRKNLRTRYAVSMLAIMFQGRPFILYDGVIPAEQSSVDGLFEETPEKPQEYQLHDMKEGHLLAFPNGIFDKLTSQPDRAMEIRFPVKGEGNTKKPLLVHFKFGRNEERPFGPST